jgi:hypothetical protein
VACKHTDWISICDSPHPYSFVAAPGEDICAVGVETHGIDILVMTHKNAKKRYMIRTPEATCPIMRTSQEIISEWSPSDVPNGMVMSLVNNETGPLVYGPKANTFIRRRG